MSGLNNYDRAIFLISEDIRGIECTYEAYPDGKPKESSKKLFKSFDPSIVVGDYVVIPTETRWNMTVVRVHAVDVVVDVESSEPVPWILAKVDRATVDAQMEQERRALDQIKVAQRKKKREDLREAVLAGAGADAAALLIGPVPTRRKGEGVYHPPGTASD